MTAGSASVLGSEVQADTSDPGYAARVYGPHRVDGGWGLLVIAGDTSAWRGSSLPWSADELPVVWFEMVAELSARLGWHAEAPVTICTAGVVR